MSKVEFKEFVRKNSHLINQVSSGKTTWQKLYELYDLYGEKSTVWNNYNINNKEETKEDNSKNNTSNTNTNTNNSSSNNSFKDILGMLKGMDLSSVQKGLNSLDKAIEAFKGVIPTETVAKDLYEPRPTYKYFED